MPCNKTLEVKALENMKYSFPIENLSYVQEDDITDFLIEVTVIDI